jgi:hypothetical protein
VCECVGLCRPTAFDQAGPQELAAQPRLPSEARELLAPQAYKTLGCVRKARGGAFAILNFELARFAKSAASSSGREATYLAKSAPFTKKMELISLYTGPPAPSLPPPSFLPPRSVSPLFRSSLPAPSASDWWQTPRASFGIGRVLVDQHLASAVFADIRSQGYSALQHATPYTRIGGYAQ